MENLSNLNRYDWFHSVEDNIVYVHYMNEQVFNTVPSNMKIYFAHYKNFDCKKYVQNLEE